MTKTDRLRARVIMAAALASGIASVILFVAAPVGSLRAARLPWSEPALLAWDAGLSLLFFLQHSGMIREGFRARLVRVIPPRYFRAVYAIVSGIALAAVVVFWQPSAHHLLVIGGPARQVVQAAAILAIAGFLWGALALRRVDLFGLAPIQAWLRATEVAKPDFVVSGPYRWVRHPFYLCAILLIWSCPDLTSDRLLFNVLWTLWICLGAKLEEADLLREFDAAYRDYRRQVPMLIPWRGSIPSA